jgi:hypothetical protein
MASRSRSVRPNTPQAKGRVVRANKDLAGSPGQGIASSGDRHDPLEYGEFAGGGFDDRDVGRGGHRA